MGVSHPIPRKSPGVSSLRASLSCCRWCKVLWAPPATRIALFPYLKCLDPLSSKIHLLLKILLPPHPPMPPAWAGSCLKPSSGWSVVGLSPWSSISTPSPHPQVLDTPPGHQQGDGDAKAVQTSPDPHGGKGQSFPQAGQVSKAGSCEKPYDSLESGGLSHGIPWVLRTLSLQGPPSATEHWTKSLQLFMLLSPGASSCTGWCPHVLCPALRRIVQASAATSLSSTIKAGSSVCQVA